MYAEEQIYDEDPTDTEEYHIYFPGASEAELTDADARITALQQKLPGFLQPQKEKLDIYTSSIHLDYRELSRADPEFNDILLNKPDFALGCLSLAVRKFLVSDKVKRTDVPLAKINARLYHFEPRISLRQLKSHMIGKFVSIRGTVIRFFKDIKPLVLQMNFICKCGSSFPRRFVDGKFSPPTSCSNGRLCRAKIFEPDKRSAVTVDWQKIRLQEEVDHKDSGRVPRNIEIELTGDLVDSCVPGDVVSICGIVKVANVEAERGNSKNAQNKSLFQIYIDANSIDNNKVDTGGKTESMDFSVRELYMIQDIAATKDIFRDIVNSICPSIYGHEIVKAGLTLAMFGGTQKYTGERNKLPIRNESHVLIVGDPGLGKSQMLMAINNISPRGVYVCGSYSTTTGLTVTLMKESGSGDYALEAGALVLGDQGCCAIDEFDKMPAEHQALLEAMEQQSVSIAKAGIVCNLPARTSVIAAANPAGGHYDRAKTVSENLKMGPALLSRFDVIFILLDKPDEERDRMLSEHVISLHGARSKKEENDVLNTSWRSSADDNDSKDDLGRYLKIKVGDFEPIPPAILRKYISYARKYCQPRLSPEACQVLQDFYLKLRRENKTPEGTPITTRQLESLIRLAEARAKLELQETVTADHARDVVAIMKKSIFDTNEDEKGNIDFRRAGGMSKKNLVQKFVRFLNQEASKQSSSEFSRQQMKTLFTKCPGFASENFNDLIDMMSSNGYILKSRSGGWKLAMSEY